MFINYGTVERRGGERGGQKSMTNGLDLLLQLIKSSSLILFILGIFEKREFFWKALLRMALANLLLKDFISLEPSFFEFSGIGSFFNLNLESSLRGFILMLCHTLGKV